MAIKTLEDGRLEFTTHGVSFVQNPEAPELLAFVASSNEILRFCGVARKSQDLLTNYQRALDTDRVQKQVTPFFKIPQNCSPTAIVLSLQSNVLSTVEFTHTDLQPLDHGIRVRELRIVFPDYDALAESEVIRLSKVFLDSRLAGAEAAPPEAEDEDAEAEQESPSNGEDALQEDSLDSEGEDTVELGHSVLRQLREKLDLESSRSTDLMNALREMLRPGLVIDGQHRLYGAAGVEENIPFLVCALINPSWKEQVFQFMVVNDKAAGIPKPFITSLAGMSLTAEELDGLRDRLAQAGLKLWEVEVMHRLGYDPESPFVNLIEFKVATITGEKSVGLGYETMKRVGKAWYSPSSNGLYKLMAALYRSPGSKKVARKVLKEEWQRTNDWFRGFCTLWARFKKKFGGTPSWEVHSHLLTAVVLESIQADFLKLRDAQSKRVWDIEEEATEARADEMWRRIEELADEFVEKYDRKLFEKEWKHKSLNHSGGKRDLADLFRKVREGESTANHVVFSGNN